MSTFECFSVLMSIILGLAVVHLLGGVSVILDQQVRGKEVDDFYEQFKMNRSTQRDEPLGFAFGVADEDTAQMARARIEEMRKSGELEEIVARMRLD